MSLEDRTNSISKQSPSSLLPPEPAERARRDEPLPSHRPSSLLPPEPERRPERKLRAEPMPEQGPGDLLPPQPAAPRRTGEVVPEHGPSSLLPQDPERFAPIPERPGRVGPGDLLPDESGPSARAEAPLPEHGPGDLLPQEAPAARRAEPELAEVSPAELLPPPPPPRPALAPRIAAIVVVVVLAVAAVVTFLPRAFEKSVPTLMAEARSSLDAGRYDAAALGLKGVLQAEPANPEARFLFGRIQVLLGQPQAAEQELRAALDLGFDRLQVFPVLGRAMLMQQRFQALLDEIPAEVAETTADPAEMLTVRGLARVGLDQLDLARADLERALARAPGYPDALLGMAHIALRQQRVEAAVELIDRSLAANPRSVDAWLLKGRALALLQRPEPAAKAYRQLLAIYPANREANIRLAEYHVVRGELEAAARLADTVLKDKPMDADGLFLLAVVAYRNGDLPVSRKLVMQAINVRPDDLAALVLAGSVLYAQGAYAEATGPLLRVLEKSPMLGVVRTLYGAALMRTGRQLSALEVLVPTLQLRPSDPELMAVIGEAYARAGDLPSARKYVEKALKLSARDGPSRDAETVKEQGVLRRADIDRALQEHADPDSVRRLLALIDIRQERYEAALEVIAGVERRVPADPVLLTLKGVALSGKNDAPAARKAFEQALALEPDHVPAAFNLSMLDIKGEDPLSARRRLEKLLSRRPNDIEALMALMTVGTMTGAADDEVKGWLQQAREQKSTGAPGLVWLGHHYLRQGNIELAAAIAAEAYAASKQDLGAMRLLGAVQLARGEASNAVTTLSQLAAALPTSPDALRLLGKAQLANGNAVAATVLLGKAMNLAPGNADILIDLAEAELAAGRTADALKTIRVAQAASPKAARPFVVAGDILLAQGNATEANQAYRQALERRSSSDVALRMHLALNQLGQRGQATEVLEQWLQAKPEDASVRSYFGSFLLQQGKYKEAVAELQAVLRQRPKDPDVLNNLAWALGELKDPRAREYAEAAFRLDNQDPAILDTLGWLLTQGGQVARGVEMLERAVSLDPGVPQIRYHLAQAYQQSGNLNGARRELERLVADPRFAAKAEAKKRLAELL